MLNPKTVAFFLVVATMLTYQANVPCVNAEALIEGGKSICANRTGVTKSDVSSYFTTENGCRLDCIILNNHYGFQMNEGSSCHSPGDWKCMRGKCLSKPEREEAPKVDYKQYDLTFSILRAYVPDEDKNPFNGESDVMILVRVFKSRGQYEEGALVGHTPTIQDSNKPEWKESNGRLFTIRPNPLPETAVLRFDVYDSDKPAKPDNLGYFEMPIKEQIVADEEYITKRYPIKKNNIQTKYYVDVKAKASEIVSNLL